MVSFGDAPWCTLVSPQLSVVAQPAYEMGRIAAELLTTSKEKRSPRKIVLTPELIVRQSSVRP